MSEAVTENATVAVEPRPLGELSPKQYNEWRMTGEIPAEEPAPDKSSETKESSAATTTEAATVKEAKPATESDPEAKSQEHGRRGVGSLTYAEMRVKIREQEAELQRLKTAPREETRVEVTPEEQPETKVEKKDARPRSTDTDENGKAKYATWEDYEDALLSWNTKQTLAEFESTQTKKQQEAKIEEQKTAITKSWNERVGKSRDEHADFDAIALGADGPGKDIAPGSVVDQWILDSPIGAELLYHFGQNRSELRRIGALHPISAARELTKLEAKLSGETPEAKAPPAETKQEIKTTKTPPPAREVAGRGTAVVDEVTKAVADDDVRAYINSANRRDIATRKR